MKSINKLNDAGWFWLTEKQGGQTIDQISNTIKMDKLAGLLIY